jgi:hypothetical protein
LPVSDANGFPRPRASRRSGNRVLVTAAIATSFVSTTSLVAQRADPVAFKPHPTLASRPPLTVLPDTSMPRRGSAAMRTLAVGALIGAGVGAVSAFVIVHRAGPHTDHSEDNLPYVVLIPMGTLLGRRRNGCGIPERLAPLALTRLQGRRFGDAAITIPHPQRTAAG